jgi:hypothetical protein
MITEDFQELPDELLHHSQQLPASTFMDRDELAAYAQACAGSCGLAYAGHRGGRDLTTDGGWTVHRHRLYTFAPPGGERESVRKLVEEIARLHGPGSWWSTGPAVGYLVRVGGEPGHVRAAMINGTPHALIAAYYFHDKAA